MTAGTPSETATLDAAPLHTKPAASTVMSTSAPHRLLVPVFVLASFLGSALLFLIQPMVGRMLLPLAGGSPSLWNTSMVFFQMVLLAGYAFAHISTKRLGMKRHPVVQAVLLLLPLLVLPVTVSAGWRLPADGSPIVWVLATLGLMVGLPFLVLSTSSPTLQRWFSFTGHRSAHDPYFLYAAGNAGSVLALLAYPFFVEPLLSLSTQTRLWTILYVAFVVLSVVAAWMVRRAGGDAQPVQRAPAPAIAPPRRFRWVFWSFVPSALMLGVTRHMATDVASVPMLWIVPLLLYLTTFIIAFGKRSPRRTEWASVAVRVGVIPLVLTFLLTSWSLPVQIGLHLVWFFLAALLGHSRLSEDRPHPERLTEFYLWISVGGVAGGIFTALLAPVVFDTVLEYPIAIALALLLTSRPVAIITVQPGATRSLVALALGGAWLAHAQHLPVLFALLAMVAVLQAAITFRQAAPLGGVVAFALLIGMVVPPSGVLAQDRSFFGVYRVRQVADGHVELASGTTIHGTQLGADASLKTSPASYYHHEGPLGQLMGEVAQRQTVGVVGLGVGGIAAYGRAGDRYTFFEIDPTVVELATNSGFFTYLSETAAQTNIVIGDGRLSLADSDKRFDILVVDAFNSDAIPVHLLTEEAIEIYLARLDEGGVVAIHVSNRHFRLAPVLGRISEQLGVSGLFQAHTPGDTARSEGSFSSHWVVLAADARSLAWADGRWSPLPTDGPLWTDDYSNILRVLELW